MSHHTRGDGHAPTPEDLREQVERTRDELGRTVEALAAKADVPARTKAKAAEVEERAVERAALLAGRLREEAVSAAVAARTHRTPLLAAATALAAFLLLRRGRRNK
ncbi:DUF3618 domain-containing protein [Streptomyces sp. NPDC006670]|uniref:DUF3618 domain-containing protein n=1 Tax=Streptomyces sp. NPDC006670 TaxID=3154476 RepID=UPI0033EBBC2C